MSAGFGSRKMDFWERFMQDGGDSEDTGNATFTNLYKEIVSPTSTGREISDQDRIDKITVIINNPDIHPKLIGHKVSKFLRENGDAWSETWKKIWKKKKNSITDNEQIRRELLEEIQKMKEQKANEDVKNTTTDLLLKLIEMFFQLSEIWENLNSSDAILNKTRENTLHNFTLVQASIEKLVRLQEDFNTATNLSNTQADDMLKVLAQELMDLARLLNKTQKDMGVSRNQIEQNITTLENDRSALQS
ncbi:uncharacterized protein LOC118435693 isoform X2 [Folsomia candida]|uniref:uncharacterized protein LOC118435693 isoform X2 n=1 Tax=Folsomia candida TaxID=158441 RepID=UPI001604E422|nr:uncharacterized protein LOC118435693 isoform X2 [Folsomia candida]